LGRENGGVNALEAVSGDLGDWPVDPGLSVAGPGVPSEPASAVATPAELQRVLMESVTCVDWPTIIRSHDAASRGDWRAVLALDREWGARPGCDGAVAEASFRAGQRQLARMRPMRDVRVVQRYREAVEAGMARGWHPVVYGVVLAVHAIPLRQGLVHHALRVASVMARMLPSGAGPHEAGAMTREAFEYDGAGRIPAALDRVLAGGLRVVTH